MLTLNVIPRLKYIAACYFFVLKWLKDMASLTRQFITNPYSVDFKIHLIS